MNTYKTEDIRNISLCGHRQCGKSSLAEALLFQSKAISRLGRADDHNLTSDYDQEEVKRGGSINSSLLPLEYQKTKVNLLDCPGNRDFVGETKSCVRVAETMLIVLDATGGVEVGSELAFEYAEEYQKPMLVFVNKMDKENADFDKTLASAKDLFGIQPVPVCLPIGAEDNFSGVIDLLRMKAVREKAGGKVTLEEIPAELADAAAEARAALIEAAAEGDEAIMEKFLDDVELSSEEIIKGLKGVLQERRFLPVLCGSATHCQGIDSLLELLVSCTPSPDQAPPMLGLKGEEEEIERTCSMSEPYSAFVFRTVSDIFLGKVNFFKVISGTLTSDSSINNHNKDKNEKIGTLLTVLGKKADNIGALHAGDIGAVAKLSVTETNDTFCDPASPVAYPPTSLPKPVCMVAISAEKKTDEDKLGMAINRLLESDITAVIKRDAALKQTVLSGIGDSHVDVCVERLKAIAKIGVVTSTPKVPYHETITKKAVGNYRHKKQSGGRGQFGEVYLRLEPQSEGYEFAWEVVGGNIPTNFTTSVQKGVEQAMEQGMIAGCQVIDIKVACFDGKHHAVDSSDMAFQTAAAMGFRQISKQCNPIILEPIMDVTVTVPEGNMGDVMGSISSKRGRPLGSESVGKMTVIKAQAPMSEMFTFTRELSSMTQGRGSFEMDFARYERVPPEVQESIVTAYQKSREEG